jgi:hypothetical protein
MYPLSIVVHGVALNITVQSYMGQLCFGLIACRRAMPDVKELADQLQRAMQVLRALAAPGHDAAAATSVPQPDAAPARGKPRLKVVPTAEAPTPMPAKAARTRRRSGVAP